MMARHFLILTLLIVALSVTLSACGRKNSPVAPDTVEETYPRDYPAKSKEPTLVK